MTVRFKLALTVLLTGLLTAAGVIATMALAFQRFEHENAYLRADEFLGRVTSQHDDLLDQHQRNPEDFTRFLTSLLLFEADSQLYLLAVDGTVLAHSSRMKLPPGFKVALGPVQQSAAAAGAAPGEAMRALAPYVMGDDPERMDAETVVAARILQRAVIHPGEAVAGYLYLVCRKASLPGARQALFRSSVAGPALAFAAALVVLGSLLAVWIIGTVTRPLRVLSDEVAAASKAGFKAAATATTASTGTSTSSGGTAPIAGNDEFSRLRQGFRSMLGTLRTQWDALQRMDHFRRESVSNLSHDLRSPLTATVACLETLDRQWLGDDNRSADRRLVHMALRNTRNAAAMVRALGDLALLDEPEFKLKLVRLDLTEVLDDIVMRFAQRAAQQHVALRFSHPASSALVASVDVELFERALANVLDNALKFTPAAGRVDVSAEVLGTQVHIAVADSGSGIATHELPRLFDRLYQARSSAKGEPPGDDLGKGLGKGLGLTIVKRIVELHGGTLHVHSTPGQGTRVQLALPVA